MILLMAMILQDVEEAGNVRFARPKGWTRESRQGAIWLIPPNVPKDRVCALILLPGEELKVKPREWFDQAWTSAFGSDKIEGSEVETAKREGFDVLSRAAVIERNGTVRCVNLIAFTPGNRIESMLYMTDGRDLYEQHLDAVRKLVDTIGFGNVKKPEPAKVELEGAWMRGDWKGFGSSRTFQYDYLFFYKGGLVCRQWNSEGQDGLDAAKAAAGSDKAWGWWGERTEKDGVVSIRWSNGGEASLVRKDKNLQEGSSQPYVYLPPVDKLALDGLYRYGDGKKSEQGGKDYEIRFTPDGRFEESNVMSAVMREGPERGSGKYRIVNYTLYLEYDGGKTVRMGFYVLGKPDSRMESVYLNTFVFSRAK